MTKNTAILILIILLLISGFGCFYFWDSSRDKSLTSDLERSQHQISLDSAHKETEAVKVHSDSVILAERNERAKDKAIQAEREKVAEKRFKEQKSQIARLKEERTNSGITVDPITKRIEEKSDSLIEAQSKEIATLKIDKRLAEESFTRENEAITAKYESVRNELDLTVPVITDLKTQLAVEKKRGKIFKYLFYGVAIYAVVKTFD